MTKRMVDTNLTKLFHCCISDIYNSADEIINYVETHPETCGVEVKISFYPAEIPTYEIKFIKSPKEVINYDKQATTKITRQAQVDSK